MKRKVLVIVLFLAFALVTADAAPAQEVWSLVETQVNPNNELVEYYGGGTTPYWYTEPRYEGKLQVYTLTSTSFSVHDVEVDHGYTYYDVTLTTNFASPPSQLTPGQTVNLTANFSHSGVVDSYPPGVQFWYSGDGVSMTPATAFGYYPWHENFSGVSSTTYSFVVPNTHSGEIKIYASWWNAPGVVAVWRYQASGTAPGNNDPQLSMASLTPTTGTSETEFTFSVKYYDADGDSPYVKWVNTNDQYNFDLDLTSGSADNGTYSTTLVNFPTGTNTYYFYFEDGQGGWARLPASGTYSGPTIGTGTTTPPVPTLIYPSNNASISTSSVTFQWSSCSGATKYHIQLATDVSFNPTTWGTQVSGTSATNNSLPNGRCFWRVRAGNNDGWSDWSNAWRLDVSAGGGGGTCKHVQGISLSRTCGTVGQAVTITVTGASGLYYRYYLNDNSYCDSTGANWILLGDWTTSNTYTWTPNSAGLKTIMVWSVVNTSDSCRGMIGGSYEVR